MQYRSLGRSGMKVSPICLGTFNFANPTPESEAIRLVERAVAAGINFLDTSNNYTNGGRSVRIGKVHSGTANQILPSVYIVGDLTRNWLRRSR